MQNQTVGSIFGEDALKLMLLNQASQSPSNMNIQQHSSPNGNSNNCRFFKKFWNFWGFFENY